MIRVHLWPPHWSSTIEMLVCPWPQYAAFGTAAGEASGETSDKVLLPLVLLLLDDFEVLEEPEAAEEADTDLPLAEDTGDPAADDDEPESDTSSLLGGLLRGCCVPMRLRFFRNASLPKSNSDFFLRFSLRTSP